MLVRLKVLPGGLRLPCGRAAVLSVALAVGHVATIAPIPRLKPVDPEQVDVDPTYVPAVDARGREVVPADLPAVPPVELPEVERMVIPVRPPAGPSRLELELPLGRPGR